MERLLEEFEEDQGLGHQMISPLDGPWTDRQWRTFIDANTFSSANKEVEWQKFEIFPGRQSCSRFFGLKDSLNSFIRKAEEGMTIITKIAKMRDDKTIILPDGLTVRLPSSKGYEGWLELLYATASCYSTPVLHVEGGNWGWTGQLQGEADGDPAHPFYQELPFDLFESSGEAISLWLGPSEAFRMADKIIDTPILLPPEPEKNGPYPPNKFWLRGKCYEFSPKPWLLLAYLWMNLPDPVRIEDAVKHVYGGADEYDNEDRFKSSALKKLQGELVKQDCPAQVHGKKSKDTTYITLE